MLSQKSKLCVQVLVAIASASPGQPVTTRTLSRTLHVSTSYLESVARTLREEGFVRAIKGPGGGYFLTRSAELISVWDVVSCIEPPFEGPASGTPTSSLIGTLEKATHDTFVGFLSARTIGDFAVNDLWEQPETMPTHSRFRLRPMPQNMRPSGPSSVFDLSSFPA